MQPTAADFDRMLANESHRFREVLESAAPTRLVPTCDPWSAADLLWHLTEVQGFWAEIVSGGHADPESVHRITRPSGYAGILDSFDAAHQALRAALAEADDPDPAWTWAEDQTVGFIRRRQAHEALIHRVDAELTAGAEVRPVEPLVAADGVDELLTVMVDGVPPWGTFEPEQETIRLECTDFPLAWQLRFGRFRGTSPDSGNTYDLDTAALEASDPTADCTVRASAWDLDRWLWGRSGSTLPEVEGADELASRLRSIISETTQ
jgi:uncharacterized protein (TIGR03083 family)